MYLTAAVAALGLAVYLSSFGPLFTASADFFTPTLLDLGVVASLLGGAACRRRPGAQAEAAARAPGGAVGTGLPAGDRDRADRARRHRHRLGLYLIIAFSVVQAIVAVAVLLFDAGVITPPAPRPNYEQQQQYSQYGGRPVLRTAQQPGAAAPAAGHATAAPWLPVAVRRWLPGRPVDRRIPERPQGGHQSGPPTPPTGFPTYGQPPSSNAPTHTGAGAAQPQRDRRHPRSPALRRRNLGRACVNFARMSVRGSGPTSGQPASRHTPGA